MSQASTTSSTSISRNCQDERSASNSGKECSICTLTFPDDAQLRLHISCHAGQKHHLCMHCPESFYLGSQLSEHNKLKHPEKEGKATVSTEDCNKMTENPKDHVVETKNEDNATNQSKRTIKREKAEVTIAPVLEKKTSPRKSGQVIAPVLEKKTSPRKSGQVIAPVLEKKPSPGKSGHVTSGNGLKAVQPLSGKLKPYVCDTCGKGCAYLAHLNRHVLVHSTEMPYKCDKCSAKFKREDGLKRHYTNVHKVTKKNV